MATRIRTPITIPMIAPVCKPLLDFEGEGKEVLVWCEALIVDGTDGVKVDIVVIGMEDEEVVIVISAVASQLPPFQLGQHWQFVMPRVAPILGYTVPVTQRVWVPVPELQHSY